MQTENSKNIMPEDIHPLRKFRYCPACGSSHFVINDFKSKRCEDCGFVYYINPSASTVAVIVNEQDELLVVRRAKEPAKGTLDLPGGFSDCSETSEEGVAREVMEETGLRVVSTQFLFSLPNLYTFSGMKIPTLDMFYQCQTDGQMEGRAMDDAEEMMWIKWEDIKPEAFGLLSIRKGVEQLLMKKNHNI